MNTLRDDGPAEGHGRPGHERDVGGTTAGYIDLANQISSKLPLVIALVLSLSFMLLLIAFRSLLVPLKAVILNLLSIGAAFGVVTFVFEPRLDGASCSGSTARYRSSRTSR